MVGRKAGDGMIVLSTQVRRTSGGGGGAGEGKRRTLVWNVLSTMDYLWRNINIET